MKVIVATDGSCLGNPGPAGWAWVHEDGTWASGSIKQGTNNIGELMAIREALKAYPEIDNLTIQSDSSYAINCISVWSAGWERNGWRKRDGKQILNVELIREIVELFRAHPGVELEWVKGHSLNVLNTWADNRALNASKNQKGLKSGVVPSNRIGKAAPANGMDN